MDQETDQSGFDYNNVFQDLVEADGGSIAGFVAYGIYKSAKRQWVTEFIERKGRQPDDADLREFAATMTTVTLKSYRQSADQVLLAYATSVIDQQRPLG